MFCRCGCSGSILRLSWPPPVIFILNVIARTFTRRSRRPRPRSCKSKKSSARVGDMHLIANPVVGVDCGVAQWIHLAQQLAGKHCRNTT